MLLNKDTGELIFADGFSLGISTKKTDTPDFPEPHDDHGVSLLPMCEFADDALCAVTLSALVPGAARQRAALFAALGLDDPCPDTRQSVQVACPFGTVTVLTDPYFGRALARVQYRSVGTAG